MARKQSYGKRKFRLIPSILVLALPWALVALLLYYQDTQEQQVVHNPERPDRITSATDHSQFEELQQDFESPKEVTEACISCHNTRHKEVMQNAHWKWERTEQTETRGEITWGKPISLITFVLVL